MNLIKLWSRMNYVFTNSKNIQTSDPHTLLLNLTDKINLNRSDKFIALSNLSIYDVWKSIQSSHKNNKSKISAATWNEKPLIT